MTHHDAVRRLISVLVCSLVGWSTVSARAAPDNAVGVNAHQPAADVLDAIKDLGATWVRIDFNWYQAEPKQGTQKWALFDTMINNALARGLKVFPTVGYGPAWASEPDKDGKPNNNAPKAGQYQRFCKAAAARYKGKITHWGLWNEPNLDFFDGTMQQWIDRIVIEGTRGIKAGCPTCKVLGPEMASIGDKHDTWFDASLKALKKVNLMYDIITWHNYSSFTELKPTWMCWSGDLFIHDLDTQRTCVVPVGRKPPMAVMKANGVGNLPLWMTETGYTAPVADAKETKNQVTYYRRVLEEQLKRSWYTHTFFYEIVDDNAIKDKWGMAVRTGSSPKYPGSYNKKPVWALVKKVLANSPRFGGSGADCNDGLDNDGDKLIDYPADRQCSSANDRSETAGSPARDAGPRPDRSVPANDRGPGPVTDNGRPDRKVTPGSDGPGAPDRTVVANDTRAPASDGPTTTPVSGGSGCAAVPAPTQPWLVGLVLLGLVFRKSFKIQ